MNDKADLALFLQDTNLGSRRGEKTTGEGRHLGGSRQQKEMSSFTEEKQHRAAEG